MQSERLRISDVENNPIYDLLVSIIYICCAMCMHLISAEEKKNIKWPSEYAQYIMFCPTNFYREHLVQNEQHTFSFICTRSDSLCVISVTNYAYKYWKSCRLIYDTPNARLLISDHSDSNRKKQQTGYKAHTHIHIHTLALK